MSDFYSIIAHYKKDEYANVLDALRNYLLSTDDTGEGTVNLDKITKELGESNHKKVLDHLVARLESGSVKIENNGLLSGLKLFLDYRGSQNE
jgi:hypothetical protein